MKRKISKIQPQKKETILVVDDSEIYQKRLSLLLEKKGYRITPAKDGKEAWEKFQKDKPELVVTDLMMPNIDGLELLKLVKNADSSTPVILISGLVQQKTAAELLKLGAEEVIEKKSNKENFEYILKTVKKVLHMSNLQKKLLHYLNLSNVLSKENEDLKNQLNEQSDAGDVDNARREIDKYKAICVEIAHGLKGEFLHIGYSLEEIREAGKGARDILDESLIIERSLAYSRILLQRLLSFIDVGSLQMGPVNPLELIKKTVTLIKPRLPSNIQLQLNDVQNIAGTEISANSEQLTGVLVEIINNAAGVLREEGGIISITPGTVDGKLSISIEDNGPGIPGKLMGKLLKEQVPSKKGLGLGLYLCGRIIHDLGGRLEITPTTGKGTVVKIILPTMKTNEEP